MTVSAPTYTNHRYPVEIVALLSGCKRCAKAPFPKSP